MDKKSIDPILKTYCSFIKNYFPVKSIILYGSYAKGTAHKDSDIDLAVIVDQINENFLDEEIRLFSLSNKIDSRIEPKLIGFNQNDVNGILEEIRKTGIILS